MNPTHRRGPAQKISLVTAYLCYAAALFCLSFAVYHGGTNGTSDSIFASLAASVVFFIGSGVVLHVMGAANLPDLRIGKAED